MKTGKMRALVILHKTLLPQICLLDVVRFKVPKVGKPEKESEGEGREWVGGIKQVQKGVLLPFLSLLSLHWSCFSPMHSREKGTTNWFLTGGILSEAPKGEFKTLYIHFDNICKKKNVVKPNLPLPKSNHFNFGLNLGIEMEVPISLA